MPRTLDEIAIALSEDIEFLENVTIEVASRCQKDSKTIDDIVVAAHDINEYGSLENGVGIKVNNEQRLACYELALYGKHGVDPRVVVESGCNGIIAYAEYFAKNAEKLPFSIFSEPSQTSHIKLSSEVKLVGYNTEKEFNDEEVLDKETWKEPLYSPRTRSMSRKENEKPQSLSKKTAANGQEKLLFIEHFSLHLPRGCLIETTNSRSIMCTAPERHMESGRDIEFTDSGMKLPYLTCDQLRHLDVLVQKAIFMNHKYNLGIELPETTNLYFVLRKLKLIEKSELSIEITDNELEIVNRYSELNKCTGGLAEEILVARQLTGQILDDRPEVSRLVQSILELAKNNLRLVGTPPLASNSSLQSEQYDDSTTTSSTISDDNEKSQQTEEKSSPPDSPPKKESKTENDSIYGEDKILEKLQHPRRQNSAEIGTPAKIKLPLTDGQRESELKIEINDEVKEEQKILQIK